MIDIESNGTIDPEECIRRAATIPQQQLVVFVDLEDAGEQTRAEPNEPEIDPVLLRPVDDLS
ncbi:hypothetical protein [Marinobacterium stanieri]|uniref:hypothetical protein n=1 Tax=Marinobacterium stanieri TaxID=49186 RepID=UPI003A930D04